jgi:Fur family ferric uptake transcriptional regulator
MRGREHPEGSTRGGSCREPRCARSSGAQLRPFPGSPLPVHGEKGLRSTDQRRLIIETFFKSHNHVSIEELLAVVRVNDARVGYATVYRTLKLLAECGVAYERRFGDGLTRYELADDTSHHDHLICVECGAITEFEEPQIEVLQEAIAAKYGYLLHSHKHEMYGLCPDCQKKSGKRN